MLKGRNRLNFAGELVIKMRVDLIISRNRDK